MTAILVSYDWIGERNTHGMGNAFFTVPAYPISADDVRNIERTVAEKAKAEQGVIMAKVVVLNIVPLSGM